MQAGDTLPVSPDATRVLGRQLLAEQPLSALLGAQLREFDPGQATVQLPLTDAVKQQHGFAHGGVSSCLADSALTFVGGAALGVPVLTAAFTSNDVPPAVGKRQVARTRCAHAGRSQAVGSCELFAVQDGTEKLCAPVQGLIDRLAQTPS